MKSHEYLEAIASGLQPPHGTFANEVSNTASLHEYDEASWWGDHMLRLANVNDWHFGNTAVAWYTGMHRLALLYVKEAIKDPKQWMRALQRQTPITASLIYSLSATL